ncbi:TniB family NTP-binding protein [Pseudomonas coronafaciens]|uniref:TniB family NTP-binding protein n=1 Tax=Pseudomonas coronafaciens TaxID=53409 RepID=UPI0006D5FB99|nr:TniB family NTP-binding protein [Pseudomonas coronafaciens]
MADHLHESRHALLELEGEARIHAINAPVFINHSQCDRVFMTMKRLMSLGPMDTYARSLLVNGCSDIGKTAFLKTLKVSDEPWLINVAFSELAEDPSGSKFMSRVWSPIGLSEVAFNKKNGMPLQRLSDYLAARNVKAMVIDEFQDYALATTADQKRFLAALKTLTGAPCFLTIFLFGTEEVARSAFERESMLVKRFKILTLLPWQEEDPEYLEFLNTCEQILPLRNASGLSSTALRREIHIITQGIPGKIITLLRAAACHGYKSGDERITIETLQRASGEDEYVY